MWDDVLMEIEKRAGAATPGPWHATISGDACEGIGTKYNDDIVCTDSGYYPPNAATAEFIAHAREDIPKLVLALKYAGMIIASHEAIQRTLNEILAGKRTSL